mgnify:CR=1 FL=1
MAFAQLQLAAPLARAVAEMGYESMTPIQAQAIPDAKTKNFRIKLLLYTCKECSNPEYACICDE